MCAMIEFDNTRYAKVGRKEVLALLARADMAPDRLTAHRNRMFTARYRRDRIESFGGDKFEARIEAVDRRVAVYKRPNRRLDRGPFVTLKFAVAAADRLGIAAVTAPDHQAAIAQSAAKSDKPQPAAENPAVPRDSSLVVVTRLNGVARDLRQLTQYAHELVVKNQKRDHLLTALDEMQKQIGLLTDGLHNLLAGESPLKQGA